MSKICILAAISNDNVIGYNGDIPSFINNHAKHFRDLTLRCPIIMGKQTQNLFLYPFDERVNIVICENKKDVIDGFVHQPSIKSAIEFAKSYNTENIFVIGGENIFEQFLPFADSLYLTEIYSDLKGDKFFPELNCTLWELQSRINFEPDANNIYPYAFVKYSRKM